VVAVIFVIVSCCDCGVVIVVAVVLDLNTLLLCLLRVIVAAWLLFCLCLLCNIIYDSWTRILEEERTISTTITTPQSQHETITKITATTTIQYNNNNNYTNTTQ